MDEENVEAEKRRNEEKGKRIPNETGRFVVKRQELEGIIHCCNRLWAPLRTKIKAS